MLIKLENVSHSYHNKYVEEKVLKDINLEIEEEKLYCVMGPSGSGKSTFLNIVGGLLKPSKGSVYVDSEDITKYTQKQLAELRLNKIGYIFQNFNLIPFLTVKDNILLQVKLAKKNVKEYMPYYESLVTRLKIKDKEDSYIYELSGGQQQRVAIARCFIIKPKIILADEPTGNLDSENTMIFIDMVRTILEDSNTTFIIVTHNERLSEYCDKTISMVDGKIEYEKEFEKREKVVS